jgi:hypothetical protein
MNDLQNLNNEEGSAMSENSPHDTQDKIRKLLASLDRNTLIDVLVDLADTDEETANYLEVRFGTRGEDEDIAILTKKIKQELRSAASRNRRGDWGHMHIETGDIYREIDEREKQGRIKLAFSELEVLFRELQDYYEYQEECEIDDECDYCIGRMAEIAESATDPSDKEFIFGHCLELCGSEGSRDYGSDSDKKLLKIAIGFLDQSNRSKFEAVISNIAVGWQKDKYKLIHYEAIQLLDGESAATTYIYNNLDCYALREIAYNYAISKKNYEEAERLCLIQEIDNAPNRRSSQWLHKLYEVYELAQNTNKQIDTARAILLNGDFKYYEKLKKLLTSQNRWDFEYVTLRNECAEKLSYSTYMQVLNAEGEYALLLEQLHKYPGHVFTYGQATSASYPDETKAIFISCIDKGAKSAVNRKGYEAVCYSIASYANSGYIDAAKELIAEYKVGYKHRPAFVDELSKIGRKLD